jgi:hypothetical protein
MASAWFITINLKLADFDKPARIPAHAAHKECKAEGHLLLSTEASEELLRK